ncbi:hypothetical protein TrRE_jg4074, partial [Triparma retinervis]
RSLGHVSTFCDISSLVVSLPERVIFRVNFSLVGSLLAGTSLPIRNMMRSRVGGRLPGLAAFFQSVSGLGVILVGACGPGEIMSVHLAAAAMGFGGSALAQMVYNYLLFTEDKSTQPESAGNILAVRCVLSAAFLACAVMLGLCEGGVGPFQEEPWGHIFEWSLWFNLLAWYWTFKWDLKDFYVGSMDGEGGGGGGG